MTRFLCTTALVATFAAPVYADAHTSAFGTVTAAETDFFASDLIGMRIYNAQTEVDLNVWVAEDAEKEWDDIGEVNDVLISQDGDVKAVILGIGGFLGLGERDVSVEMDAIKVVREQDDNDRFLVVTTSKEILENAPVFVRNTADGMTETKVAATAAPAQTHSAADTAMDRPLLTRPDVQRDGFMTVAQADFDRLTTEDLTGAYVYGIKDETVGEVDRLILGDDGKISHAVLNIGGFLGLGEKPVAVSFDELQLIRNNDGDELRIYIESSEEKLEALPEFTG